MKKRVLYTAPLGARNRRDVLFSEIVSHHPGNDYSSVLYLVPNTVAASAARSRFYSYLQHHCHKSAFIPFQFLTVKQFSGRLYEAFGSESIISDRMRALLISVILKDNNIGFAATLADLYRKVRHYIPERTIGQVKEEIKNLIFEERALSRAVRALETLEIYEGEMRQKGIVDQEGVLAKTAELLKDDAWKTVYPATTLVIEGFFDPTPLEMTVMGALMDNADTVYMLAEEHAGIINYVHSQKKGFRANKLDAPGMRQKAGYHSYPSIEDEVEGIARTIKKCILDGIKPWEITLCFPSLAKYLPIVKRVSKKFGLPVSIGQYRLTSTSPFMAIDAMISSLESDYSRNDFLSFLTSSCFSGIPAVVRERALRYSYMAGVVKGKESWLSIQETMLHSPRDSISAEEKQVITEFQAGVTGILTVFESIKGEKEPLSFINAFESALSKFGFFDVSKNPETADQTPQIVAKISRQLEEFRRFEGFFSSGELTANGFLVYLKYLLSDIQGSEENRDGIKISSFEHAASSEAKAIFFGGLIEGDFPSRPGIDPVLPEKVKKELGLPYLDYYLKRQKRYFLRLLNISSRDPFFSCPSADGEKIFLPSPFLDWEQKIPLPELNIFSEEESLIREGTLQQRYHHSGQSCEAKFLSSDKGGWLLRRRTEIMAKNFISVTDIDYYRRCPLRYYIEKVLSLEVTTPPRFEVEARLWGNLAHRTMEYVFSAGDTDIEGLEEKIMKGLEKSLRQFPIGDFWSKVAKEIFINLLPALKAQEADMRMEGYVPIKTEEKLRADFDGLKLKGKVDRIDRKAETQSIRLNSGTEAQGMTPNPGGAVILLDYKTGNVDRNSLQLPLYAAMWELHFSEPVEKLGYYSLKEGKVIWHKPKSSIEEVVREALQMTRDLLEQLRKGKFSSEPFRADECRHCYHGPLCK